MLDGSLGYRGPALVTNASSSCRSVVTSSSAVAFPQCTHQRWPTRASDEHHLLMLGGSGPALVAIDGDDLAEPFPCCRGGRPESTLARACLPALVDVRLPRSLTGWRSRPVLADARFLVALGSSGGGLPTTRSVAAAGPPHHSLDSSGGGLPTSSSAAATASFLLSASPARRGAALRSFPMRGCSHVGVSERENWGIVWRL
jgi:hypothetical protein